MAIKQLKYRDLKWDIRVNLDDIEDKDPGLIDQKRIEVAITKLTSIRTNDYNMFICGNLSPAQKETVRRMIKEASGNGKGDIYDFCYVNNFKNPKMPKVLKLPSGKGKKLAKLMDELVNYLKKSVPDLFESKEYEKRIQDVVKYYEKKQKELYEEIQKTANEMDFVLKFSQMGISILPIVAGKAISEREFASLSDELKKSIEEKRRKLEEHINEFLRKSKELEKEKLDRIKKINDEMGLLIVSQKIDEIKAQFKGLHDVESYLDQVEEYTLNNIAIFLPQKNQPFPFLQLQNRYVEYKVNVFVDNEETKGIPVIYEENPTYYNVFGKIEKQAYLGAFITDFTHIVAGSIHKANGGYLILDAFSVLTSPGVWDTLKKSLLAKKSTIEEWSEKYGIIASETLKPEPIELQVNVVMVGPEYLYDLLFYYDDDFQKLFKLKTNYNHAVPKTKDNVRAFAAKIMAYCKENNLKFPDKGAIVSLLKYAARLSDDKEKLWAYHDDITDIVKEADRNTQGNYIQQKDVELIIKQRQFLRDLWREKIYEMIETGQIIIDLKGKKIGEINGLSVIDLGDFSFGRPNKITVKTFLGKEGIINIERESKLSGKIFDKASMIIAGYLGSMYGFNKPLGFSATISFEQSYSYIEGDSASVAETVALLSSLAGVEIKQNLAVTGSMNQNGEVQPIGGVNEKIEGFYDICKLTGNLKGSGVVIPHKNTRNLVLRDDVLNAVKKGDFSIYTIEHIDEAIELFSGMKAGKRTKKGFERGTFHYLVDRKIKQMNEFYRKNDEGNE